MTIRTRSTAHGGHPRWRGAPVATTIASSVLHPLGLLDVGDPLLALWQPASG
jgi:hypothetical protein